MNDRPEAPMRAVVAHREPPSRTLSAPRFTPLPRERWNEMGAIFYGETPVQVNGWENDTYYGLVRWYRSGFPIGGGPFAILTISARDETARHDWREFQELKNLIIGDEWEAVELYPSESRLIDPSNRFFLWCVPPGVLKFGLPGGRHVVGPRDAIAPQRPFPRPVKP